ncbi:MAG: hypothetical protein JRI23_06095 [Deltaproteobacteria bacterium]|jgi:hypothetical protein|nr:hypothetical protein [Deltaproteobacteria bacterium]MBW2531139.1 hypothetical protein [Deltaproteobacteria bacterium]
MKSIIERRVRTIAAAALLWAVMVTGASCDSDSPAGPVCNEGEIVCSDDAFEVRTCVDGAWQINACMRDGMQLCEDGQCVDPWRYGSPTWPTCEGEPRGTEESLRDKAIYFEGIAKRLHVHPDLKWMMAVTLPCLEVACSGGETPPCYDCTQPAVPEATATYDDVETWHSGENDGLWSALYLAAEAYRYAVTGEAEALEMIELLLEGQRRRMAITGVPGLYTRQNIPPDIEGLSCPTELERYVPDVEKDDNQWVRVGPGGCVQVVDPDTMEFVATDHCGLEEFAGWCWLDNVSQDEYSGHMLAHAAIAKLVDDANIQAKNNELLRQIGQHLMDHELELTDWDGRRTEHGKLWPGDTLSGFAATISLAYMQTVAFATGDAEVRDWIDRCMLGPPADEPACIYKFGAATLPYDELLEPASLYLGCMANWNGFAMHMMSLHTLLLHEQNPRIRSAAQHALQYDMFEPDGVERPLVEQHNALYNFIFAADKALGPGSDGHAYDEVEDGICMLKQFPASEHQRAMSCTAPGCVEVCSDRLDKPLTDYPRPVAERCLRTFLWWGSPYTLNECTEDLRHIKPPSDYLLAYWMGRYYGFIDESM